MSQITIQDLSFTYEGTTSPSFSTWTFSWTPAGNWGLWPQWPGQDNSAPSAGGEPVRRRSPHPADRTIYFPRLVAEPERPAREILLEGIPWEEEWMLLRELNRLGLDEDILDRPFSSLSGGEQTRAGLARLFCQEDGYPMLDEPTNTWMRPDAPSQPGTSGGWTAASFWCPTTGPFWMPAPTTRWL